MLLSFGIFWQNKSPVQISSVHGLLSSQSSFVAHGQGSVSKIQLPASSVKSSPSKQLSMEHNVPSLQVGGVPGWHPSKLSHVSCPLQ